MITSQTVFKNNTSGIRGVYQNKRSQKWVAQITFKGRTYYLGSFENKEDAAKARQRGEEMYEDFLAWYYAEHPAGGSGRRKGALSRIQNTETGGNTNLFGFPRFLNLCPVPVYSLGCSSCMTATAVSSISL